MKPRVRLFNDPRKAVVTVNGHSSLVGYAPAHHCRGAMPPDMVLLSFVSLEQAVKEEIDYHGWRISNRFKSYKEPDT